MNNVPPIVQRLADEVGGRIDHCQILPDGSGGATMSMPLPKDHWLTAEHDNTPPMPMRLGTDNPLREPMAQALRAAGRYAVRCATMNGKEDDFDPDALVQNLVTGFLGYWTPNGLSSDDWANPPDPGCSLTRGS